jgi:hypothetical protein
VSAPGKDTGIGKFPSHAFALNQAWGLTASVKVFTIEATIVNLGREGAIVKLKFLGKDSTPGDSPTLYATDRGTYVIQGWKVTDSEALSQMKIPERETCIEVPKGLMRYLPKEGHEDDKP